MTTINGTLLDPKIQLTSTSLTLSTANRVISTARTATAALRANSRRLRRCSEVSDGCARAGVDTLS